MIGRFYRIASAVLATAALIIASCAVQAQNDAQIVSYHGVAFPAAFADGVRTSTRNFEPSHPGLGVSAGYRHRGAISTMYVYDLRMTAIPSDLRADVVIKQFEQARGDIRASLSAVGTMESKGRFMIADAGKQPRLMCEGFVLQRDSADTPRDSYLCLGVTNNNFFKVRTTMPPNPNSEAEARRFIGAWVATIWK